MKLIKWLGVAFFCALALNMHSNTYASSLIVPGSITPATEVGKNSKASEFVKISLKDYSSIIGKKMNVKEKISFIILKKRMKQELKKNPHLTVSDFLAAEKKIGTGWWILIIAGSLALILLIIAAISIANIHWF